MTRKQRRANKDALTVARNMAGQNLGPADGEPAVAQGWASDFCELADAIQNPRVLVTNRDRDTLAKGLPFGSMTNRHGESIRPYYRSEAEAV